jgi:transposase-like protein
MSKGNTARIGSGINGEVWPCPSCEKHESVKFLSGNEYRYYCCDCYIEFEERSQDTRSDGGQTDE